MDLKECYSKGFIKKTKANSELIKSLIEMSNLKEDVVKKAKVDNINISVYFSIAYDSLREILEAICISKGYKVTSHLCIGELLREILTDFNFIDFDRMRYTRNGINYYGTKIDFEQGKELIKKMFDMKKELAGKYIKKFY